MDPEVRFCGLTRKLLGQPLDKPAVLDTTPSAVIRAQSATTADPRPPG